MPWVGFCLSRCSSCCVPSCCRLQARDARHHGRFGPEVQLRRHWWHAWLVLLVTLHLPLCFLPCLQARDARHHGRYGPEGMLRFALQKTADFRSRSSSQVVDFLLRCRGLFPWSCCSADHRVSPVAPVHVVGVPVMQVVLIPGGLQFLVQADEMHVVGNNRCLELDSVENCRGSAVAVLQWSSISPSWRRGRCHSPVAEHGDRCPCCARHAGSGAAVEKTFVLPQLQFVLSLSWRRVGFPWSKLFS